MGAPDPVSAVQKALETLQPEAIGISVRNIDDQRMTDTTVFLEEVRTVVMVCRSLAEAPIILGGAGYSIYPSSLLEYLGVEIGIQGEGEAAFPLLLERLANKGDLADVPGVHLSGTTFHPRRDLETHLDSFALPDNRWLPQDLARDEDFWVPVQTRRGCPMECSYCSTSTIEGRALRTRSPQAVVQWIDRAAAQGFERFYFVDNTFNLPPSYAKELCRELIASARNIVFRSIIYPLHLDEELVALMAAAGCRECSLGFESGSELVLHGMNKKFHLDDVVNASQLLAKHGIRRMGFLLLGGPGETRETALASLKFADSLNLEAMKVSVGIRIYPYTRLAEIAAEEGAIAPDDDLLSPRFYVTCGLEQWLLETVAEWVATRPGWLF
jgi:radical SAM superfamily enzyme YgiQ (UPF0313 family)